ARVCGRGSSPRVSLASLGSRAAVSGKLLSKTSVDCISQCLQFMQRDVEPFTLVSRRRRLPCLYDVITPPIYQLRHPKRDLLWVLQPHARHVGAPITIA